MKPAIAIPAFNRPHALQRLLTSLQQAHYTDGVHLVISIDRPRRGDARQQQLNEEVYQLACGFEWPHGPKEVIYHREHLGLIGNVFFCGRLSHRFGSVILLEDDLYVSQAFYIYAIQALDFYQDDPRIAGIALNTLWFNGYTHQPFIPYLDAADVFFLPIPWYQGQAYTAGQWDAFATWYETANTTISPDDALHELFRAFPSTDWFPIKTKYLVNNGRYYVFPRESLTTNFGEPGTHFRQPTTFFQVPLQHFRRQYQFHPLDSAIAVYDAFFEIQPDRLNRLTGLFADYSYDIDLYATKSPPRLQADYVLTTRPYHAALCTFGKTMRPMEANIVANIPGNEIAFCRKEDVDTGWTASRTTAQNNNDYFAHYHRLGRRQRLRYTLASWLRPNHGKGVSL
jgi:hypothetical protein